MTRRIGEHHVLARHMKTVEGVAETGEIVGLTDLQHRGDFITRQMSHPAQGNVDPFPRRGYQRCVSNHRPVGAFAHRHLGVEPPAHTNLLRAGGDIGFRQITHIDQIGRQGPHIGAAPRDLLIASKRDKRHPGDHHPDRMVGGRPKPGEHPEIGQKHPKMGITRNHRGTRPGPRARNSHRVRTCLGEAEQQLMKN